jgi:hypothetical protein
VVNTNKRTARQSVRRQYRQESKDKQESGVYRHGEAETDSRMQTDRRAGNIQTIGRRQK